ncbi:MAG: hypothetical protein FWC26_05105 [Fibromonadales bacterium]|nr:hypothetical protein [Fibromonadales bacterium]
MGYNLDRHHRRSIRLRNYNYANAGVYYITICCKNRECLFGEIVAEKMILNEFGEIAFNEWKNTIKIRSNVKLCEFVVMPNHFHGIVEIIDNGGGVAYNDGGICDGGNGGGICNRGVCNTPLRQRTNALHSPSNTVGAIIRGYKSAVTKQIWARRGVLHTPLTTNVPITTNTPNTHIATTVLYESIWQRNYYERIIRSDAEYARVVKYINDNPAKWKGDIFNPCR